MKVEDMKLEKSGWAEDGAERFIYRKASYKH